MRRKYDLYYTLNTNIPVREFTPKEENGFWERINKLDSSQIQAVILLIYEHSLVTAETDTVVALPESLELPYGGKQRKTTVAFEFDLFPYELKWILFKFFEVLNVSPLPSLIK